jgi:D-tyrosyl-tRNA(Tyr) deacylase
VKAVVQRVTQASVTVDHHAVGEIGHGLVVLLGVARGDTEKEADYLAEKILQLRIFEDDNGKMNRSLQDTGGGVLVVSQFTLLGDCRKGRRPSFAAAAPPEQAEALYAHFVRKVAQMGVPTATGRFRASMQVALTNDGPVTLVLEV